MRFVLITTTNFTGIKEAFIINNPELVEGSGIN